MVAGSGTGLTQTWVPMKLHAGQISFPGGRSEPADSDPKATALRDAAEEIGLPESSVTVVGYLEPLAVVIEEERMVAWCACKRTGNEPFCDGAHAAL